MKRRRWMIVLLAAWAGSAHAREVKELVGVRPGSVMPQVAEATAGSRSSMPFVFFGAPTSLPALAELFPSAELYALRDGTLIGMRWKRAFGTKAECDRAADAARTLLEPYASVAAADKHRWRYQSQSPDGEIGVGISCRRNEGAYFEAQIELVHFETDKKLSLLTK